MLAPPPHPFPPALVLLLLPAYSCPVCWAFKTSTMYLIVLVLKELLYHYFTNAIPSTEEVLLIICMNAHTYHY